jgi:cation transport ATPase
VADIVRTGTPTARTRPFAARPASPGAGSAGLPAEPAARYGLRLAACVPAAALVVVVSLAPGLQFTGWQWVGLGLAGPVAIGGAWPVHRAAWRGLLLGTASADLTVSLGIVVALGWSVLGLLFGEAGSLGLRERFAWTIAGTGPAQVYLNVAAAATVAALAGRWARAWVAGPDAGREEGASGGEHLGGERLGGERGGEQRAAGVLAVCVITVAVAAAGFWLGSGMSGAAACGVAAAVLLAACPAGLVWPVAGLVARRRGAELGIGAGESLALETGGRAGVAVLDADVLAECDDVLAVAGALRLARATRAVSGAGMRWAVGYTVVVVPVAALGYLSPLLAVPAAGVSSLLVLASAARLRRWQ